MDGVDIFVAGDGLEPNVRDSPVDKALTHVVFRLSLGRDNAGQFGLFPYAIGRVGQQVIRVLCCHEARARERQGDAAGVARDPAPAPLLGDVGRGAATAGRIEHKVARISGHEQAALDQPRGRLNDVDRAAGPPHIRPQVCNCHCWKVVGESHVSQGAAV